MTARILTVLLWLAAGAANGQQNTVIQAETRVVLVDAIVTGKKGAYVRDLTAKDFRVWQDGKEQAIKSLTFQAKSADTQPHFLVLFFDNTGIPARDQAPVRQAAAGFVDANSGPNHLVAVVNYNGSVRVAQNFTDNSGRLKNAVNRAESSVAAPVAEEILSPLATDASHASGASDVGSRYMLRSLGNLTKGLGILPGRKIVVLFSGKLSSLSEQQSALAAAIEASNKSGVAIYSIDVRPASGPNAVPVAGEFQSQRDDSAIGGPDPEAASRELLSRLANGTGGFFTPNSGDLRAELQRIGEEQSEYYTLSYSPPEANEGSCHTLRVKVNRGGTTVRARTNYCNSKPLDLLAGTALGKDLESRAASGQTDNISASMQLPYFYISSSVARVHLAMEIATGALKFENQKGKLHAEINMLGIANAADGGVAARFSDAVKLDADNLAQVETLRGKPLHYEKEFKIAPGQYSFAMVISSGANFGKLEIPLIVDPWKSDNLALSGLVLSKEVHPAADLGLGLDVSLIEDRTPLIAEGRQVVPSGSNQFLKSEPVYFYFEVYGPNPAAVTARARVTDRQTGDPKWDSGPLKLSSSQQGGSIPGNSLAPGSYRLEVAASGSIYAQAKRIADFEVK
jgi:VWFA-related protein